MSQPIDDHSTLKTAAERDPGAPAATSLRVSIVFYHREGTAVLELREAGAAVVGRSFPSDLAIADPSLSRMHARFVWCDGVLTVKDLDSTNGTRVAGVKVTEARIHSGDELSLGDVTASVHIMTPESALQQGIESYDRIRERLREEVLRARTFGRSLALLMIRSTSADGAQIGRWAPDVRRGCQPVDHVGIYDARTLMVLLPEQSAEQAIARGAALLAEVSPSFALSAGLAVFPDMAGSDEELLSLCRETSLLSDVGQVRLARVSRESTPAAVALPIVLDPNMQALYRTVWQVAPRGIPVLIVGETGVGKEVVAAALHEAAQRPGPLRVINCATIPAQLTESILFGHEKGAFTGALKRSSGLFEEASGGTVFLDEIGELSPSAQASLLRVLQEKRIMRVGSTQEIDVDVRVIAATHRNLEDMVSRGEFRKDLYYRLNAITLEVPPLRERRGEIRPLAQRFLETAVSQWGGRARRLSDATLALIESYDWPGNVRELRNVIERAVALCDRDKIEPLDLPSGLRRDAGALHEHATTVAPSTFAPPAASEIPPGAPALDDSLFRDRVRDYEIGLIRDALEKAGGNATRAADLLRIPIRTLTYKMKAYGMRES